MSTRTLLALHQRGESLSHCDTSTTNGIIECKRQARNVHFMCQEIPAPVSNSISARDFQTRHHRVHNHNHNPDRQRRGRRQRQTRNRHGRAGISLSSHQSETMPARAELNTAAPGTTHLPASPANIMFLSWAPRSHQQREQQQCERASERVAESSPDLIDILRERHMRTRLCKRARIKHTEEHANTVRAPHNTPTAHSRAEHKTEQQQSHSRIFFGDVRSKRVFCLLLKVFTCRTPATSRNANTAR